MSHQTLKIACFNAKSWTRRKCEISQLIFDEKIDIICIQETWMNKNTSEIKIPNFKTLKSNPTMRRGGGICILLKDHINFKLTKMTKPNSDLELMVTQIKTKGESLKIGCCYIHPKANAETVQNLENYLDENIILCGDFNAHHKSWSIGTENPRGKKLHKIFRKKNLKVVKQKNSPTLFNLKTKKHGSPDFFVIGKQKTKDVLKLKIGPDLGSDHLPLILTIKVNIEKRKSQKPHWLYQKLDAKKYRDLLNKELLINSNNNYNTIDDEYIEWVEKVLDSARKCCPRSSDTYRHKGNTWWNDECALQVQNRSKSRRAYQRDRTMKNYFEYRTQNRKTNKIIEASKKKFWANFCSNLKINDAYKLCRNLSDSKILPVSVKVENGLVITEPKNIANAIGRFFSDCGKSGSKVSGKRKIETSENSIHIRPNEDELISYEEVKTKVKWLNLKKASGPDEMHPFMIKKGGEIIINTLVRLFNKILKEGKSPKMWSDATIIPIPKRLGMKISVEEFRPISLTSVVGKIFESIINDRLTKMVEAYNLIPNFQNGFRRGRSTKDCLIRLQQEIHSAFQGKKTALTAFLDIKKAYDCVDRKILLKKTSSLPIGPLMKKWLKNFLLVKRKATIVFDKTRSEWFEFKYGVPQGSPLSPLLFNIYTKDLVPTGSEKISQFADDIAIWEIDKDIDLAMLRLNKRLSMLSYRAQEINLSFSTRKCICVPFTRKRIENDHVNVRLNGSRIQTRSEYKYLGLTFDKRLTWGLHIDSIKNRAENRVFTLRKLSNQVTGVNQKILITLYKTLVRPVFEYASEVWGDASETNLKRLDSVQHRALTACLGVNRMSKRTFTLLECGVLPLKYRRMLSIFKVFKTAKNNENWSDVLNVDQNKRLVEKRRKSFLEKSESLCKELNINSQLISQIPFNTVRNRIIRLWAIELEKSRPKSTNNKCFPKHMKIGKGYRSFSNNRQIGALWHQARLGTLPLNRFLNTIKVSKNPKCFSCKRDETVEHFLFDCPLYSNIRRFHLPANPSLGRFLDLDTPPPRKRKIAGFIKLALKKRKKLIQAKPRK